MTTTNFEQLKNQFGNSGKLEPTPMDLLEIQVSIEPDAIFSQFIEAFMFKIEVSNPQIQRYVQLTKEEARYYFEFLLYSRLQYLSGKKVNFDLLNGLYVPAFVDVALAMIGTYTDLSRNLRITVSQPETREFDEDEIVRLGLKFERLSQATNMVKGGLSRGKDGDAEVMTTACIAGYVRSMSEVSHPLKTYLVGFLNTKIVEESSFKMLYRVQYDDIQRMQRVYADAGDALC